MMTDTESSIRSGTKVASATFAPSRQAALAMLVPLLGVIAGLDYATGYELSFFIFYFLPVALSAWWLGGTGAFLTAGVCTITWYLADLGSGHHYSVPAYGVWNALVRLAAFLAIGLSLARIKQSLARERELTRQLRQALAELEAATAQSRKLRDQFVTVCAWTRRIKDEGKWVRFEDYLQKHLGVRLTHGISENAVDEILRELAPEQPNADSTGPA